MRTARFVPVAEPGAAEAARLGVAGLDAAEAAGLGAAGLGVARLDAAGLDAAGLGVEAIGVAEAAGLVVGLTVKLGLFLEDPESTADCEMMDATFADGTGGAGGLADGAAAGFGGTTEKLAIVFLGVEFLPAFDSAKRESESIHMSRISTLAEHRDGSVQVVGWVDKIQTFKKHSFLTVRDGAGEQNRVQIVVSGPLSADVSVEAYVRVSGHVRSLPKGAYSSQAVEVHAQSVEMLSPARSDFPSRCPSDAGAEVRQDERHLYIRDAQFSLITHARAALMKALRLTFEDMKCTEIDPPLFVGNQCEGGAALFPIQHPGKAGSDAVTAYLSQSSQFYLEFAVAGVGDSYCIAHSARAEKSNTRRHLTDFLHAEAEWAGILTFDDHLEKLRQLLRGTIRHFIETCREKGDLLGQLDRLDPGKRLTERMDRLTKMADDILVMSHREAIDYCRAHDIWKDADTKTPFSDRDDIPEAQERAMIDQIGRIVFLVKFPKEFKSFYMGLDPADPSYVLGCDVEVPGVGEIVGSGVRVSDEATLLARMAEEGLKPEDYREYIDLRRYGHGKTSGMGLGVDRCLTWLLDMHSIRDVVTFPRYPGRLFP